MKTTLLLVSGILFMLIACGKSTEPEESVQDESVQDSNSSGNPLTAPVDYLGAIGKAKKSAVRTIELSSLKQNIQLFYGAEGRFPKNLNELVSMGYLSKLPAPPHGSRFAYNPADGQIALVELPPTEPPQ